MADQLCSVSFNSEKTNRNNWAILGHTENQFSQDATSPRFACQGAGYAHPSAHIFLIPARKPRAHRHGRSVGARRGPDDRPCDANGAMRVNTGSAPSCHMRKGGLCHPEPTRKLTRNPLCHSLKTGLLTLMRGLKPDFSCLPRGPVPDGFPASGTSVAYGFAQQPSLFRKQRPPMSPNSQIRNCPSPLGAGGRFPFPPPPSAQFPWGQPPTHHAATPSAMQRRRSRPSVVNIRIKSEFFGRKDQGGGVPTIPRPSTDSTMSFATTSRNYSKQQMPNPDPAGRGIVPLRALSLGP